jgi:hypothetical protein
VNYFSSRDDWKVTRAREKVKRIGKWPIIHLTPLISHFSFLISHLLAPHSDWRMASFTPGINGGATLKEVTPRDNSFDMHFDRPASSPHTDKGMSGTSLWTISRSLKMTW